MSLVDFLQTMGGRLGILEAPAAAGPGEPRKVVTRTVTLEELKSEIRSAEVRALADQPAELALPYERIFEAAGVARPAGAWNLAKLRDMLRTDPYRSRKREAAQRSLLEALGSEKASPEELVREAIAQDQALDQFEAFARRKTADRAALAERRKAEIDARIRDLQAERARLDESIRIERERLEEWLGRKRAYERELASAVGYLTDKAVITTD
jgi:chromosome segregation ATPase